MLAMNMNNRTKRIVAACLAVFIVLSMVAGMAVYILYAI